MADFNEKFGVTKKLRFAFVLGVMSKNFVVIILHLTQATPCDTSDVVLILSEIR